MGWCHEFGVAIDDHREHPMVAASDACPCEVCGTSYRGTSDDQAERAQLESLVTLVVATREALPWRDANGAGAGPGAIGEFHAPEPSSDLTHG